MAQEILEFETLTEVLKDLDRRGIIGLQRYRAMNGYISLKARYTDTPVSGVFELTPLCNLDCKMCYVYLNANQIGADERLLTVSEWKKIMRQAVDAGMLYATLTGGECLTYSGFRELYLHLVSMGVQPDILTNGRLLTEDMVAFLAQYPPAVIQVSVYGSDEDAYEQVTGHRAFHEVMQGIARAKAAGLNITLAITPNRYMQEDVQALLDLVRAQDVIYTVGEGTLEAREETGRSLKDYGVEIERYFEIKQSEWSYYAEKQTPQVTKALPRYIPKNRQLLMGLPCGGAHSTFHVNWKGLLCPCTGFSGAVQCNIIEQGFDKAWGELRQAMKAYRAPVECNNCSFSDICAGCPAETGMGQLVGRLNKAVCQRIQRYAEMDRTLGANSCVVDATMQKERKVSLDEKSISKAQREKGRL